jgi:hypothetical protein
MNRFWGHSMSVAGLALAAASAFPACAHNNASLFVNTVLQPPNPSGGTCTYDGTPAAAFLSSGQVDAALSIAYTPVFLLGNQLIEQGNGTIPVPETARIEVQNAVVQVVDPRTGATIEDNTVLTDAFLNPAAGTSPSYSPIAVTIMDEAAIAHFTPANGSSSNVALVNVTFNGVTLGNENVSSNVFQFPVQVCKGCLVGYPATAAKGYCAGDVPQASTAAACMLGQDQPVDCQSCSNLDFVAAAGDNVGEFCRGLGPQ